MTANFSLFSTLHYTLQGVNQRVSGLFFLRGTPHANFAGVHGSAARGLREASSRGFFPPLPVRVCGLGPAYGEIPPM